jgi:pimeloyl-ACP methyl ester carboxylesterase
MDIPAWGNSVQVFAEIEKRMGPRSKLEVVPGAGHFVVMEQPKAVARALARLLLDSEQALRSAL